MAPPKKPKPIAITPELQKDIATDTAKRKLRYMQQVQEDIEKNPPSAVPPDVMESFIRGGRPALYKTATEMQDVIVRYFRDNMAEVRDDEGNLVGYKFRNRISLGDLAIYLGMVPQQLWEYGKRDAFAETIKKAKTIIENYYEKALQENRNPAGICFILKNGFGWKDVQDVKIQPVQPLQPDDPTVLSKEATLLTDGTDDD